MNGAVESFIECRGIVHGSVQRLLLSSHPKVEARTRSLVDLATVN